MLPLVSETLMSLFRVSILTSPAVPRISMSPTPFVTFTGLAMSATTMSPFSFRIVSEAFFGTATSRSRLMRESPVLTPVAWIS